LDEKPFYHPFERFVPVLPSRKIEISIFLAMVTDELKESVNKLQQFNTEVAFTS